jgi:hypothetical protein
MASIRLGDLLVKAKVINDTQLKAALNEQQKWGGRLGELLVRMNFVTEDMLVKALSKQLSLVTVNLDAVQSIPPHVRAKVPMDVARDLVALPLQLRDEGKTLVVVMAEPQNLKHVDTLRSVSRCRVVTQIAGRQSIARAFARFYEADAPLGEVEGSFKLIDAQNNTLIKSAEERARRASVPSMSVGMPPSPAGPLPVPRSSGAQVARPVPASSGSQARQPAGGAPVVEELPASLAGRSPSEVLRLVEEAQRREVSALKGMVELLIEKGVFTREEYLAKVKRGA